MRLGHAREADLLQPVLAEFADDDHLLRGRTPAGRSAAEIIAFAPYRRQIRMVSVFIQGHQWRHHRPMPDAEVRVRRYEASDREAAVLLAPRLETGVASWRDTEAVGKAATGWIESSLANADTEGREVFVAHAGGKVVGLITVSERLHFAGETDAYVGELVVQATHERRGVGTLLLHAAEAWARRRGLRHITLETGAANGTARAFYSRCGYQEEDVRLTKRLD